MTVQNSNSEYFQVGKGSRAYTVTINYASGHWCTCRGMTSKKGTYGEDAGRTKGTCCKHVKGIIDSKFDGDWGVSTGQGNPRTRKNAPPPVMPVQTSRRTAILAQRARRESAKQVTAPNTNSLTERIAALAAAKS